MSAADEQAPPDASLRPRRWFSWVWLVPAVAAAIVIGLAIRGLCLLYTSDAADE